MTIIIIVFLTFVLFLFCWGVLGFVIIDWQVKRYCARQGMTEVYIKKTKSKFSFNSEFEKSDFYQLIFKWSTTNGGGGYFTLFREVTGFVNGQRKSKLIGLEVLFLYIYAIHVNE